MNASNRYRSILLFCALVCGGIWVLPRRVSAVNPAAESKGNAGLSRPTAVEAKPETCDSVALADNVATEDVAHELAPEPVPVGFSESLPPALGAAAPETVHSGLVWPLKQAEGGRRGGERTVPPPPVEAPTGVPDEASPDFGAGEMAPGGRSAKTRVQSDPRAARSHYSPYEAKSLAEPVPRNPAQEAVQLRALQREQERRRRIEARRWSGFEPSRPSVSAVPFMNGSGWDLEIVVNNDLQTCDRPTPSFGYLPNQRRP